MKKRKLTDAQAMQVLYPETFEAPTVEQLMKVKVGTSVKVCIADLERPWVTVTEITGDKIRGILDNELVFTGQHGLRLGDYITFEKRHIYQIWE